MLSTSRAHYSILNVTSFATQMGIALINFALVYHLRYVFNLRADQIGIATSIYTATYLLSCIFGEKWAGRFSPRSCVQASLLLMAASIIVVVTASSVLVVYGALAAYGIVMSLMWPQIEAWISRGKEGRQLNSAMSAFNFSWSFGAGVAPFVAGILVEQGTGTALLSGAGLLMTVFLFLWGSAFFLPSIRHVPSEKHTVDATVVKDTSTSLRFFCWIGVVLVYSGMSVIQTIFPLFAHDSLGLSESVTGALLLARGLTTCLSFFLLGRSSWWQFRPTVIFGVQIVFAVLCLIAVNFSAVWMYIPFFILFGIIFAGAYNLSMFHGASGSINRARRMMVHEVLLTVGTIIGASTGGMIYEALGFHAVLVMLAMVTGGIALVEILAFLRMRAHGPAFQAK